MLKMVVFVNGRRLSFVSVYALMQVPTRIPHISCIAQVTFKFVYYILLVDNGGLGFLHLEIFIEFSTHKHRLDGSSYFFYITQLAHQSNHCLDPILLSSIDFLLNSTQCKLQYKFPRNTVSKISLRFTSFLYSPSSYTFFNNGCVTSIRIHRKPLLIFWQHFTS